MKSLLAKNQCFSSVAIQIQCRLDQNTIKQLAESSQRRSAFPYSLVLGLVCCNGNIGTHVAAVVTTMFPILLAVTLAAGCQTPGGSRTETDRIEASIVKRLTHEEARHYFLQDLDREIQTAQTRGDADSQVILKIAQSHRTKLASRLESFLPRSRPSDEVWLYRTYVTADRRGGDSGLALLRNRKVVEHLAVMTGD